MLNKDLKTTVDFLTFSKRFSGNKKGAPFSGAPYF